MLGMHGCALCRSLINSFFFSLGEDSVLPSFSQFIFILAMWAFSQKKSHEILVTTPSDPQILSFHIPGMRFDYPYLSISKMHDLIVISGH